MMVKMKDSCTLLTISSVFPSVDLQSSPRQAEWVRQPVHFLLSMVVKVVLVAFTFHGLNRGRLVEDSRLYAHPFIYASDMLYFSMNLTTAGSFPIHAICRPFHGHDTPLGTDNFRQFLEVHP